MWKAVVCALALACSPAVAAAEVAGYVLSVQGRWSVQGARAVLAVGAPVPSDSRLVVAAPALGDHIVVVASRSGAVLASRRCDSATACATPLRLQRADHPADAPMQQLVDRVFARLAGEPDRYVVTMSRGRGPLDDRILSLDERRVDLAPVFADFPAGAYEVRLSPLRCRGERACGERPIRGHVDWQPAVRGHAGLDDVGPGLYEIAVRAVAGDPVRDRARGWVLLLPASEHEAAERRYRSGVALAERWGGAVAADERRSFTRALLDALLEP